MGNVTSEGYEGISGAVQLVASQLGKYVGGAFGQAYAMFLTGQNSWAASVADLAGKVQNGTAKPEDFGDVAARTAQLLAAFGVLTGTAAPWTLGAAGIAAGAVWAWKNRETVEDSAIVGFEKMRELTGESLQHVHEVYDLAISSTSYVIEDVVNFFSRAQQFVFRRDPLILDLDGDGIETVAANSTNPILFDHNADGIKTGTGWVKSDDGFLVLDRNGNGRIDSVAELFGVDTALSQGGKATDGFAALRDLDSNGDGVMDTRDARFGELRIWRDLDQDGVSDAGELQSLSELGIVSLNLNATASNRDLGNGNVQTAVSTFTRADGTTGTAANLNLVTDTFHREFWTFVQRVLKNFISAMGSCLTQARVVYLGGVTA